ncbi:hypothetical protein CTKZ_08610 [Cellulomonas algicola]|uniref:Lipoprotein n=1 Tax=Cellulomonas algicola TaxID=2071633 RepID=A0A401UX90_9CELL|nr:hypothetical protein [Cellulomonas algicola]GCD19299.1 hypothetical protein CTKZ_08610 [Cellulomonas algicola]
MPRITPVYALLTTTLLLATLAGCATDDANPTAQSSDDAVATATPTTTEPDTFEGSVTVQFVSDTFVSESPTEGCVFLAPGGLPDGGWIGDLDQLVVRDANGTIVATADGSAPAFTETPVKTCSRTYELAGLPGQMEFFAITTGPYTSEEVIDAADLAGGYTWQLNG